jgi:hypothetical protein
MALIEIDEDEVKVARSAKALLDQLNAGDTQTDFLKLVKKRNPNMPIPQVDLAQPIEAASAATLERIAKAQKEFDDRVAAEKKEKADARVARQIEQGRDFLKTHGYTEDGVNAVEGLMLKKGLSDYEDAVVLYERSHPTQEDPVSPIAYSHGWDVAAPAEEDAKHKLLLSNPDAFAQREAAEVLREMRAPDWRNR